VGSAIKDSETDGTKGEQWEIKNTHKFLCGKYKVKFIL
jgi:hypothetical protein